MTQSGEHVMAFTIPIAGIPASFDGTAVAGHVKLAAGGETFFYPAVELLQLRGHVGLFHFFIHVVSF